MENTCHVLSSMHVYCFATGHGADHIKNISTILLRGGSVGTCLLRRCLAMLWANPSKYLLRHTTGSYREQYELTPNLHISIQLRSFFFNSLESMTRSSRLFPLSFFSEKFYMLFLFLTFSSHVVLYDFIIYLICSQINSRILSKEPWIGI
jgi:hypothetical protein